MKQTLVVLLVFLVAVAAFNVPSSSSSSSSSSNPTKPSSKFSKAAVDRFPTARKAALTFNTFATGLCSPRGLEAYGNAIFVAEAGVAGDQDEQFFADLGSNTTFGLSGRVTRIPLPGAPGPSASQVVLDGLASRAIVGGGVANSAFGPSATAHTPQGKLLVSVGVAFNSLGVPYDVVLTPQAATTVVYADTLAAETTLNPDGDEINSNPYDLLMLASGTLLVVDAGANTIWSVDKTPSHNVTAGSVFDEISRPCIEPGTGLCTEVPPNLGEGVGPNFCCGYYGAGVTTYPSDNVPTTVALRPGKPELYAGSLTGAMWNSNQASIVILDPNNLAKPARNFVGGFNAIISLAFDGPDNLYVLEQNFFGLGSFAGTNRLTQIFVPAKQLTVFSTNLNQATSLLIVNGVLYASNKANSVQVSPCSGEIASVNLHPTGPAPPAPPHGGPSGAPPAPPGPPSNMGMGMSGAAIQHASITM